MNVRQIIEENPSSTGRGFVVVIVYFIFIPAGIDEYGNVGSPVPRFTDNYDCQRAFKAYMCYVNFPRSVASKRRRRLASAGFERLTTLDA